MKIIDNNGLNYLVKNKISLDEQFCITPDIKDEFEVEFGEKLPDNVYNIVEDDSFDRASYLKNYKDMLNKYKGRSFYNMTGFGDISILALLKTEKESSQNRLPSMKQECDVMTTDPGLTKRIKTEFADSADEFDSKICIYTDREYFSKKSLVNE